MLKIKELPENERPYERCERWGAAALSDAELLAVIIRTGTKQKRSVELAVDILRLCEGSSLSGLHDLSMAQLKKIPGIGRVKAQAILDYRSAHGAFRSVEELLNVDGIGEKLLAKIRDYVTVSPDN